MGFGWLSKRLAKKNFMLEELSRNQSILRFDVISQHDWPIEQCLLHTEIFFGRKTRSLCLIFHALGDKTNNEHLPKPFFKVIRKSLYSSTGCCSSCLKRIRKCYGKVFRLHGITLTARKFELLAVQKFER